MSKVARLFALLIAVLYAGGAAAQIRGSMPALGTIPSLMSLNGIYTSNILPPAQNYTGFTAYTTDLGPVYSNGIAWIDASAASGPAGGSLAGTYPNPTIAINVQLPGSPTTTTQPLGDNSTRIATTAFVLANGSGAPSGVAGGSLAGTYPNPSIGTSVNLPGTPTTTTQAPGDNTTAIATDAFVLANTNSAPTGAAGGSLGGTYPNPSIASNVSLPGSPTTTTQAPGDNTTKVATTAFVLANGGGSPSGAAGGSLAGTYPNPTIASSVSLPGSPTTTTQAINDNSTNVATTAYVANTLASPPSIGATAANAIHATTLAASSTISGAGFTAYFASPPAIGGTAAAAGTFTTLIATASLSGAGTTSLFATPPALGGSTPAAVTGTTVTATNKYVHGVTVLCNVSSASATTHTGDTTETNLTNCTVPAQIMGSQGMLRITTVWLRTATTTNTVTYTIRFSTTQGDASGGALALNSGNSTSGNVTITAEDFVRNTSATAQLYACNTSFNPGACSVAVTTSAIDTNNNVTYVNFNCRDTTSASDTCGIYAYMVELMEP